MANTNATEFRNILVDMPDFPGTDVEFWLLTRFAANGTEAFPKKKYVLTLDANGQGTQALPVPSSDAWLWRVVTPDGKPPYNPTLAAGADLQLTTWLASAQSTETAASLVDQFAGLANFDAHVVDTTAVHGITDTSLLETTAGAQAKADAVAGDLATHEADTSNPHAVTAVQAGADPAGSAAAVAGDLTDHEGDTGAGVHGAGVTGAALLATATRDAARVVVGLAAVGIPPRFIDHMRLTFGAADVVGSGALVTFAGGQWQLASGATANSRYRYRVADNTICLNYTDEGASWNRKLEFYGYLRNSVANAQGVFRAFFGKQTSSAFGLATGISYVAIEVLNATLTNAHVCSGGAVTAVSLTPTALPTPFFIQSENGTVNFYAGGVLIGTTASGPASANQPASISYEIENGATAADYKIRVWSQSKGY